MNPQHDMAAPEETLPGNLAGDRAADRMERFLRQLTAQHGEEAGLIVLGDFALRAFGARRHRLTAEVIVDQRTLGELRDYHAITPLSRGANARFDGPDGLFVAVQVEHRHRLRVPFDELQAHAVERSGLWVACPEHLLVLEMAELVRCGNGWRGDLTRRNLLQLCAGWLTQPDLLRAHLVPDEWERLGGLLATPGHWQALADFHYESAATFQADALRRFHDFKPRRGPNAAKPWGKKLYQTSVAPSRELLGRSRQSDCPTDLPQG